MSQSNVPQSDPSSAFDQIVDDGEARQACAAWAYGEVGTGRSPEDVAAELVAQGWSPEEAEYIAEEARRATRGLRGGVTHDQAIHAAGARDPRRIHSSMPGNHKFGFIGLFLSTLYRMFTLRKLSRRKLK